MKIGKKIMVAAAVVASMYNCVCEFVCIYIHIYI